MTLTATLIDTVATTEYETLSRLFKAAGDPLRLEILRVLRRDSYGVLELCQIFAIRQPAMSHHLKVLAEAGLVSRKREATSVFYRRAHPASGEGMDEALRAIFAVADRLQLNEATLNGIATIQSERAAQSRGFFAANAERLREQQELIAPRGQYEDAVVEMITGAISSPARSVLELGPGEGWLLPHLAQCFEHVLAIDNSPAMLEKAQSACTGAGISNVQLKLDDSGYLRRHTIGADLAIANMVLHHTPSPANVIQDLAQALRPGGSLLVTDLCAHEQAWTRDSCGDLWMGFAPEELSTWAHDAGLVDGNSVYLALRNGFRVQIRLFNQADPRSRQDA